MRSGLWLVQGLVRAEAAACGACPSLIPETRSRRRLATCLMWKATSRCLGWACTLRAIPKHEGKLRPRGAGYWARYPACQPLALDRGELQTDSKGSS